jgi:EAL domain-containing protein (putative c-di-GMP-specific phosphodiesterase class I)
VTGDNRRSQEPAARRRRESIRRLKDAMAGQRVTVHYQPIVDAKTGRAVSAEALLRWREPDAEPDELPQLVAAAEQSPVIYALERWSIAECFRDGARWQASLLPDLRLNVNLSAREFSRPHFSRVLQRAMRDSGIDPARVTLEITETSSLGDPERASRAMAELKGLGFEIWLDDFGTGHSSLEWLWELPVDGLKIPGTFVGSVTTDAQAAIITSAVVELAHRLAVRIVAEGVETEEQRRWLAAAGCDHLQGYLFHEAVPADHLQQELAARASRG